MRTENPLDLEAFLRSPQASDYLADSPIKVLVEWFLNEKEAQNLQPRTLDFYRLRLDYLIESVGDRRAAEVSPAHLKAVISHLKTTRKWSVQNTNHFIQVIKTFFTYLETEEEVIESNPARRIKKLRKPSTFPVPFTCEQVSTILSVIGQDFNGIRDRVMVLVLLDSGVRVGELMGLGTGDIDVAGQQMRVFGKGRKERIVFFGPTVRRALMKYAAVRAALVKKLDVRNDRFWLTGSGSALAEDTFQYQLRVYGARAKVEHVHPHRFRHTFATEYLRNGGSLEMLQRLLGHTTPQMTMRYAHLVDMDAKANHAAASPVERWKP